MTIASNFPAIKPSLLLDFANTKRLDPRVTFTRATTGTYYDGVTTAMAEQNLLTYSQAFDDPTWLLSTATVTANSIAAPDGTTTADTLTGGAGTVLKRVYQGITLTSGTYTFSVFAKAGTHSFIQLFYGGTGTDYADFNISTGTAGNVQGTSTITAVGSSGWYRVTHTFTANAQTLVAISLVDSNTASRAASTSATGDVYLWGAQLEQRSSVTAYTATTTQPITNYIPVLLTAASGVPRFDHNPTTDESLGLLIEEQRTNLILQSEDFSTTWTNVNSSEQTNIIVSPAGTLTGDKVIADATSNVHTMRQSFSWTASTTYTFSIYAKKAEQTFLRVEFFIGGVGGVALYVNVDTGAVTTTSNTWTVGSSSATLVGNGWYRCVITFTVGATGGAGNVDVGGTTASGTTTYTGNGYDGIFIWGAQLEAGAFATSYIPTTSASVTRNADTASMTGPNFSSWFSNAEGALYAESQTVSLAANRGIWAIGDPTLAFSSGNMLYEAYASAVSGNRACNVFTNGNQQVTSLGTNTAQIINTFSKGAFAYKINDFAESTNAATASTDSSGTVPIGPTALSIGSLTSGWSGATNYLNGTIKKLAYYPIRLTNANLQALTS